MTCSHLRFQMPEDVWGVSSCCYHSRTSHIPKAPTPLSTFVLFSNLQPIVLFRKSSSFPFQHFLAPLWLNVVIQLVLANELWVEVLWVISGHLIAQVRPSWAFFPLGPSNWQHSRYGFSANLRPCVTLMGRATLPTHNGHVLNVENKPSMFKSLRCGGLCYCAVT